jgi:8-oxo-dGTP pyrophosphatase MutT (NUDIX family)
LTTEIEYTDPEVLTIGVAEGWADPETNPADIGDWAERLAAAAIPYQVTPEGRPVRPFPWSGPPFGRGGLGKWGENKMCDARVTATVGGLRYVLLVKRRDNGRWAFPGGAVERGEGVVEAALRELFEETGLGVTDPTSLCRPQQPRHVEDHRERGGEAWTVSCPVDIDLGDVAALPAVVGGDDAAAAAWMPAFDYPSLTAVLHHDHNGSVFAAHEPMLRELLRPAAG